MSGDAYAAHVRHRKMVAARSEAAKQRAEMGEKHPDFENEDSQ